jgi:predicted ATPase/DNA-binding SARP family transcriptional activator
VVSGASPLWAPAEHRSTLPHPRTSFVGRGAVVDDLAGAIAAHRLVTIRGPGGVGKTRTAIEAARQLLPSFSGGVFFVDLTRVPDGDGVIPAFVDGIGRAVPPGRTSQEHLVGYLGDRTALLVVDNCEHVQQRVGQVVDGLLAATPHLRVLATSREVLDVDGEHVVPLWGLDTEGVGSSAVELFVQRARDADHRFVVDDEALDAAADIARRLDGLPLAIELAAARTRTLVPRQIVALLDDRFRLLVSARRTPERQQTLEATIGWSYDLLTHDEQRALRLLSTCAGPFTLRVVRQLLGVDEVAAAEQLDSLVAKSLVVVDQGERLPAYRLLETIREFGRQRVEELGEAEEARGALERALLPAHDVVDGADWIRFAEELVVWDEELVVEAATRRDAARRAMAAGRLDAAAHLFLTSTGPTESGSHEELLTTVQELYRRRSELDRDGRRSIGLASVMAATFANRGFAALKAADDTLDALDPADPSRRFVDSWRHMVMAHSDPASTLTATDHLLATTEDDVGPPPDYATSFTASARAACLGIFDRMPEARETAEFAVRWAGSDRVDHDIALAVRIWVDHLDGRRPNAAAEQASRARVVDTGLLVTPIAAAASAHAPLTERAARLNEIVRRRPVGRYLLEEASFLTGYLWLAIEAGDDDRIGEILDVCVPREPASLLAICSAHRRLGGWDGTDDEARVQALVDQFNAPGQIHRLLRTAPGVLAAEVERWDGRRVAPAGRAASVDRGVDAAGPARIALLGPLEVQVGGREITVSARQQRALLELLALRAGQGLPAAALVDALWGADPPASAARSLRSQVSRLRRLVGPDLVVGDGVSGYRLAVEPDAVDASQFEALVAGATAEDGPRRVECLRRALELWRGAPLADLADTSLARAEATALEEQRALAEEDLAAALLEADGADEAVVLLERLVEAEPLRERRWALLVDALTSAHRVPEALRAYQRARDLLVGELGLEPGPLLRDAEARALGTTT